jgi:hypothetical protein
VTTIDKLSVPSELTPARPMGPADPDPARITPGPGQPRRRVGPTKINRWARGGAVIVVGALSLAACGGSAKTSAPTTSSPVTTAKATTVPTVTATTPAPSTTVTTSPPTTATTTDPAGAAYAGARSQWQQAEQQPTATQNQYFLTAANDLNAQASSPGFSDAVAELKNLASIPETNVTSAQMAQAQSDVAALDQFFNTPGLYR